MRKHQPCGEPDLETARRAAKKSANAVYYRENRDRLRKAKAAYYRQNRERLLERFRTRPRKPRDPAARKAENYRYYWKNRERLLEQKRVKRKVESGI